MGNVVKAIRELATYLGGKLDTLIASMGATQEIQVDFGSSSKELSDAATKMGMVAEHMARTAKSQDLRDAQMALVESATAIKEVADKLYVMKPADMGETNKLIGQAIKSIKGIKIKEHKTDVSKVERLLLDISETLNSPQEKPVDRTDEVIKAISGIKFEVPKEFKLDDNQLRSIRSGGIGPVGGSSGADLKPTKVTVANVAMTTADTEYSYTFPKGTTGFRIKLRDQGVLLYYAWETGKTPGEGDGSAYETVQQNHELVREHLDIGGKTIYLETDSATQVAEIEVYSI